MTSILTIFIRIYSSCSKSVVYFRGCLSGLYLLMIANVTLNENKIAINSWTC